MSKLATLAVHSVGEPCKSIDLSIRGPLIVSETGRSGLVDRVRGVAARRGDRRRAKRQAQARLLDVLMEAARTTGLF